MVGCVELAWDPTSPTRGRSEYDGVEVGSKSGQRAEPLNYGNGIVLTRSCCSCCGNVQAAALIARRVCRSNGRVPSKLAPVGCSKNWLRPS